MTKWQNFRSSSCFTNEREICHGRLASVHIVDAQRSAVSDCHVDADEESTPRIYSSLSVTAPSRAFGRARKAKYRENPARSRWRTTTVHEFFTDLAQPLTEARRRRRLRTVLSIVPETQGLACTPRTLRATHSLQTARTRS